MFCLYCGTNLPEDAIFCNKCGRQQNAPSNKPVTNVTILPYANESTPSSAPPQPPTVASRFAGQQLESSMPQAHHADTGTSASPAASQGESLPSPAPYPHAIGPVPPDGVKLAGTLSRRTVVATIAGITGLAIIGSVFTFQALSRKQAAAPTTSSSGAQLPTPSPTTPPAAVVSLAYSTNLDAWGINYDRPSAIPLSTTPPSNNWTLPPSTGIQRLFGTLHFGDNTQVGVVVDRLTDLSASNPYYNANVIFNFTGGTDFSNQPTYASSGNGSQPIEFTINYANGSRQMFAIIIYTASVNSTYGFNYYRACVRQGTAKLDGIDHPIAITSENDDGIYSNLDSVDVTMDINGNGTFEDSEHFSASQPFVLKGTSYVIQSIASDGSSMTIIKS